MGADRIDVILSSSRPRGAQLRAQGLDVCVDRAVAAVGSALFRFDVPPELDLPTDTLIAPMKLFRTARPRRSFASRPASSGGGEPAPGENGLRILSTVDRYGFIYEYTPYGL